MKRRYLSGEILTRAAYDIQQAAWRLKALEDIPYKNDQVKQQADLSNMIWSVAEQIAKLSEANELCPGDIIYSGTPENVAAVQRGDVLEGVVEGVGTVRTKIVCCASAPGTSTP